MISAIRIFFKELFTPSGIDGPAHVAYDRGATAVFHGVLGAAAMYLLTLAGIGTGAGALAIVAAYIVKEAMDMRAGGKLQDSIEDIAAVAIGAACYALPAFSVILLCLGVITMFISIWKR